MSVWLYPSETRTQSFFTVCDECVECPPSGVPYIRAALITIPVVGVYECLECGTKTEVN